LVKAYTGGVQLALASLPTVERSPCAQVAVVFDYGAITLLKRLLPDYEAEVLEEEYAADVTYRLCLPSQHVDAFGSAIASLTNGQAVFELLARDA
jgi:putative IMPACT (imprinted ancient) family translation regulator